MLLKVLPVNRAAAQLAGLSAKVPTQLCVPKALKIWSRVLRGPCSMRYVLNAAKAQRFPSSLLALGRSTVQTAITPKVLAARAV